MHKNKSMVWGLSVLNVLLLSGAAHAADSLFKKNGSGIDVQKLQKQLQSEKAGWTARPNRLTEMNRSELVRRLGLTVPPAGTARFTLKHPGLHAHDAGSLDWRNYNGVNYVSPVLDQGDCGSCVAFASVATLETQVNITSGLPWLNPKFSPQALFECGGGACNAGWTPDSAVSYLTSSGVPDEACAPYTIGATGVDVSCNSICSDADSRSTKIIGSTSPTSGGTDIEAVKAALKQGPLITTLNVYADFMAYSSGVYKHVSGDMLGGHAVSIVGYDDGGRYWIIRNSWGADWGENGFMRVSWDDDSGIGGETYGLQVGTQDGYVSIQNPRDRAFVSGGITVAVESTFADAKSVTFYLADGTGKSLGSTACTDLSHCKLDLDTTKLADGVYIGRAETIRASGAKVDSAEEYFYVMNSTPSLSLSFGPQDGGDFSKPLSGVVQFDIKSSTGNNLVPLQYVEFHLVQDGKTMEVRRANVVLDDMVLDWGTDRWPDGKYEIYFTGALTVNGKLFTVESQHYTVTANNSSASN